MRMDRIKALGIIRAACIQSNPLRWGTITQEHIIEAFEQRIGLDDIRVAVFAALSESAAKSLYTQFAALDMQHDDIETLSDQEIILLAGNLESFVSHQI